MQKEGCFATCALDDHVHASSLSEADKAFAHKMVLGVTQMHGCLDEVVDRYLAHPNKTRPQVRLILQMGAYELLCLGKEPAHAVDQAVRLANAFTPYAASLVNAVLRSISRKEDALTQASQSEDMPELCRMHGFPVQFGALLEHEVGMRYACTLISLANDPSPVFLYANQLVAPEADTLSCLRSAHIDFESYGHVPGCIRLGTPKDLSRDTVSRLIEEGCLIVSDFAAQSIAHMAATIADVETFCEIGAGRGTKSVLIQSMHARIFGHQIPHYVAVDVDPRKADMLREKARASAVHIDEICTADAAERFLPSSSLFDVVFLDAPCSGSGTLRRHPEIRERLCAVSLEDMARTQRRMLASAAHHVNEGGTLMYSTCSVTHTENDAVIASFIASGEGRSFSLTQGFCTVCTEDGPDSHTLYAFKRS